MSTLIIMPEMGEGIIEGTVVRWLKAEGDSVQRDEPVLEIETDKVNVEVPADADGTLLKINAAEGATLPVGSVLAIIGQAGEAIPDDQPEQHAPTAQQHNSQASAAPVTASASATTSESTPARAIDGVRVSPVVARMVQEHAIDVHALNGTGRDGRITKHDVLEYLETAETTDTSVSAPSAPRPAPADPANGDLMPLSAMRRAIADHMVRSVHTSPHATTIFEFDFHTVAAHRAAHKDAFAQQGVKLTYLPYLALATAAALRAHPLVNSSWTDDGILLKRGIQLGIAVAVDSGLLVPVIRDADTLNLVGMARAINDLSDRARANQIKPDDLRGGTFTITNHGVAGSLFATPIINQPQVGILGFGMIEKRVKVIDDMIAVRPCAYLSFSFDHRVLDGATADAFMSAIKVGIESFSG